MCLLVTKLTPYNKSGVAYKVLETNRDLNKIYSIYFPAEWKNKRFEVSHYPYKIDEIANCGIHVFTKVGDARIALSKTLNHKDMILVKLKVSGFLGAGIHIKYSDWGDGMTGEVWQKAKIVKILAVRQLWDYHIFKRPLAEKLESLIVPMATNVSKPIVKRKTNKFRRIRKGNWVRFRKHSNSWDAYKVNRVKNDIFWVLYGGVEYEYAYSVNSAVRVRFGDKRYKFRR